MSLTAYWRRALTQVSEFDLRNASLIVREHTQAYSDDSMLADELEFNSLSLNDAETSLAVASDSGQVLVLKRKTLDEARRIDAHDNLCTAVAFVPGAGNELLSCGTDCVWRRQRCNNGKLLERFSAEDLPPVHSNPAQLINPAYAHALACSRDGRTYAVALGDGRLVVQGDRGERAIALAHAAAATSVDLTADQDAQQLLLSGGSDRRIRLFRKRVRARGANRWTLEPCLDVERAQKLNHAIAECDQSGVFTGKLYAATAGNEIEVLTLS